MRWFFPVRIAKVRSKRPNTLRNRAQTATKRLQLTICLLGGIKSKCLARCFEQGVGSREKGA
jgi:hypothetical protein